MPLTITQIRKNCGQARSLFERAETGQFALGAFNLDNQETLVAVARAAYNKKSPILVEVSKNEVDAVGLDNLRDLVDNYKAQYGLEMYINLDHSPTVKDAIEGIEAGFECIHIDISQADHKATRQEIIEGTKEVVKAARLTGAMVEAEERYFMGSSNLHTEKINFEQLKKFATKPDEAVDFVTQTGIDTFAAQVGNLHGLYAVPKVLDLELLKSIRGAIDCNISLHGGSGTPAHYFVEAIKIGVSKININSDLRVAYRTTLEKVLKENKTEYAVIKLMGAVIEEVQKVVEDKIDMFNSAGKIKS